MFHRKITMAMLAAVTTAFALTTAAVLGRQATSEKGGPWPNGGAEFQGYQKAMEKRKAFSTQPSPTGTTDPERAGGRAVVPVGSEPGRGNDPRSLQILAKLEEPISMSFANETPLDHVLKYIKAATTTKTFNGIPIYVDPVGLQEAERSLNSTVQIDLEGAPLRRTLQLLLAQLDLVYFVEDGILVITSKDSEAPSSLPPSMARPSPIFEKVQRAERGELTVSELKELIEYHKLLNEMQRLGNPEGGAEHRPAGETAKKADQTAELIKDLRELIQLLKAERQAKKPSEAK